MVGVGHSLVLAQMLEPGIDQEGLQYPLGVLGVLEQVPGVRAIAPPRVTHYVGARTPLPPAPR